MSLIEGVGDEVIQFFIVILIICIAFIAWRSTGISDRQIFRTVLILERRSRLRSEQPTTANSSVESNDTGQSEVVVAAEENIEETESASAVKNEGPSNSVDGGDTSSVLSSDQDLEETTVLRQRRITFFQSRQVTLLEPTASDTKDLTVSTGDNSDSPENSDNIRIRLKYLNEDQKLVDGKLQEQLGDFKRRHFALELAADKLVRLIFNGQVLGSDSETLQSLGLFDNCVVHCLIHNSRPGQNASSSLTNTSSTNNGSNPSMLGVTVGVGGGREWDLGNILFASLSFIIGLAWYCRLQYAQLFSATTTVALVGLTGILVISLVGMYLPDHDSVQQQ